MNLIETLRVSPGYKRKPGETLTIRMGPPGGPNVWTVTRFSAARVAAAHHALAVKEAREKWERADRRSAL